METQFFKPDEIFLQACEAVGSDRFGPEGWKDGFETLLERLDHEVELSELGREMFGILIMRAQISGLGMANWAEEDQEFLTQPVERPIIIVGMARAGTTLLSYLFDQHDRF